jgi:outer membrane protein OmpA-like peptidoglycan-associated protein
MAHLLVPRLLRVPVLAAALLGAGLAAAQAPAGFKTASQIEAELRLATPARSTASSDADLLRAALGGAAPAPDKALRDVARPEPDGRCGGTTRATATAAEPAPAHRALAVVAIGSARQPHVDLQLRFGVAGYALTPDDRRQLDELVTVLKGSLSDARVTIAGHTDRQGLADLNLRLSCARGLAVLDYLVARGLGAERFGVYGFGSSQAAGNDDAGSRRVEIRRAD